MLPTVGQGGAERMASELIRRTSARYEHHIVTLIADAPFFDFGEAPITCLGMGRGELSATAALRFRRDVRRIGPDLIQGWLYHGNLVSTLAKSLCRNVVWSIHNTNLDRKHSKRLTRATNRVCAWLSPYVPRKIIYASPDARTVHEAIGYHPDKGIVIENGIDMGEVPSGRAARLRARAELQIPAGQVVVAQIGRFDPQKDHATAIEAFRQVVEHSPEARLVLAGEGCTEDNETLTGLIAAAGLVHHVRLLGPRQDLRELLAGIDVVLIASAYGEALPLVALEAAASGTLLVTTSVGSASELALRPEHVVPASNPGAMATALILAIESDLEEGKALRRRVLERYDLKTKLAEYTSLYDSLLG